MLVNIFLNPPVVANQIQPWLSQRKLFKTQNIETNYEEIEASIQQTENNLQGLEPN